MDKHTNNELVWFLVKLNWGLSRPQSDDEIRCFLDLNCMESIPLLDRNFWEGKEEYSPEAKLRQVEQELDYYFERVHGQVMSWLEEEYTLRGEQGFIKKWIANGYLVNQLLETVEDPASRKVSILEYAATQYEKNYTVESIQEQWNSLIEDIQARENR